MRSRHQREGGEAETPIETEASKEPQAPTEVKLSKRLKKAKLKSPPSVPFPLSIFELAALASLLGLLFLAYVSFGTMFSSRIHNTCLASDPLVQKTPHFLDKESFRALQESALNHPYISEQVLAERNFAGTHGFVIRFSAAGVANLTSDPQLARVADFFHKVRNPDANAFVINLLVAKSGSKQEAVKDIDFKGDMVEYAVGLHLDNTVAIHPVLSFPTMKDIFFMAHQTNVLYLSVPEGMKGGQLVLYEHAECLKRDKYPTYRSMDCSQSKPQETVRPMENMMIQFRGDAFHGVLAYKSKSGMRVSIVMEQFKIPEKHVDKLTQYEIDMDLDYKQG